MGRGPGLGHVWNMSGMQHETMLARSKFLVCGRHGLMWAIHFNVVWLKPHMGHIKIQNRDKTLLGSCVEVVANLIRTMSGSVAWLTQGPGLRNRLALIWH